MSQPKTTRAFRTISEAGDELDLQPHVLRFWESKFAQIKPIKRGGGRRFYRPDDIEFIRGIKKLLHDEKHSIKDVQKLIQKKGAARVVELGRSLEKASREKPVAETDLLPKRIKSVETTSGQARIRMPVLRPRKAAPAPERDNDPAPAPVQAAMPVTLAQPSANPIAGAPPSPGVVDTEDVFRVDRLVLEDALKSLQSLKVKLSDFRESGKSP
jgi:DNA-binding transcriptional MerR regulator